MFPSSPNLVRLCTAPNPPSFVGSHPLRWRNAIRSPQPLVPCTLEHTIGRWMTSGPTPRTRRSVFGMACSWLRTLAWHILRRVRNVYPELRKYGCYPASVRLSSKYKSPVPCCFELPHSIQLLQLPHPTQQPNSQPFAMKLTAAVALNLAVLAIAAPTTTYDKRQPANPVAVITNPTQAQKQRLTLLLKGIMDMLNIGQQESSSSASGPKPTPTMTPNSNMNFPGEKPMQVQQHAAVSSSVIKPSETSHFHVSAAATSSVSISDNTASATPTSTSSTSTTPTPSPSEKPDSNPLSGITDLITGLLGKSN